MLGWEVQSYLNNWGKWFNCETCASCNTLSKPTVGLLLATVDFNQTVAVDLHELETYVWWLHIIDEFTRFRVEAIIKWKLPNVFVQEFISKWLSISRCPKSLFSDDGGEFNNTETRDVRKYDHWVDHNFC